MSPVSAAASSDATTRKRRWWSLEQLRTDPVLSQADIGGGKLGAQLDNVILFSMSTAKNGQITLNGSGRGLGSQAREMEPKLAALLGALFTSADVKQMKIDHIALSPTSGSHAAMHLATLCAAGMFDGKSGAEIVRNLEPMRRMGMFGGDFAYYHNTSRGRYLVLGPEATRVMMRLTSGRPLNPKEARSAIATLRHELQHAVTPRGASAKAMKINWVEESTASLLAGWKGGAERTAAAMGVEGVPAGDMDDMDPYVGGTRALRQLVAWAGADVHSESGYDKAYDLLQNRRLEKVPGALAAAIGATHKLSPAQVKQLETAIFELQAFKPQARKRLVELAKKFGLPLDYRL